MEEELKPTFVPLEENRADWIASQHPVNLSLPQTIVVGESIGHVSGLSRLKTILVDTENPRPETERRVSPEIYKSLFGAELPPDKVIGLQARAVTLDAWAAAVILEVEKHWAAKPIVLPEFQLVAELLSDGEPSSYGDGQFVLRLSAVVGPSPLVAEFTRWAKEGLPRDLVVSSLGESSRRYVGARCRQIGHTVDGGSIRVAAEWEFAYDERRDETDGDKPGKFP